MRYLLFGSDELENSKAVGEFQQWCGWWHILDAKEMKIVAGSDGQAHGAPDLNLQS